MVKPDVVIEEQSPEWRMQRALEEVEKIMELYHCQINVVHQIQVLPLRLVPVQPDKLEA